MTNSVCWLHITTYFSFIARIQRHSVYFLNSLKITLIEYFKVHNLWYSTTFFLIIYLMEEL